MTLDSGLRRTLFSEGRTRHPRGGTAEKRGRGWTPRHCSRIDAPQRLSSPFWALPRGRRRRSSPVMTDLCVYSRTRVCGWLIGGTMKSMSRKRKQNERNVEIEEARRRTGNKDSAVIRIRVVFDTENTVVIIIGVIFVRLIYGRRVNHALAFYRYLGKLRQVYIVYVPWSWWIYITQKIYFS